MSGNIIDELPEGGLGIKIMSRIADELSYTRTSEQRNCLLIVKNYEQLNLTESQTPQRIYLQVNTDLHNLEQVLEWFKQLQNQAVYQAQCFWYQCLLALTEGFTNSVRHAHKHLSPETPIELEITMFRERVEMRIWDYGQPFDLEAKLSEVRELERHRTLSEKGHSFRLMTSLADCVSYTQTAMSGIV